MSAQLTKKVLVPEGDPDARVKEAQRRTQQAGRLVDIGQMVVVVAHEGRNALQETMFDLQILASKLTDRPELLDVVNRAKRSERPGTPVRGLAWLRGLTRASA